MKRLPGTTYAISDTGPLISAFQSESFDLLTQLFAAILVSTTCVAELKAHGWEDEIQSTSPCLAHVTLTASEKQRAWMFAKKIGEHSTTTHDLIAEHHLGEAEAIVLALRPEYHKDLLLLDELAAREVAKQAGVRLSGFPGVLLLAAQTSLISAKELKTRLETCRRQGTHFGETFIQQVYEMAKKRRR